MKSLLIAALLLVSLLNATTVLGWYPRLEEESWRDPDQPFAIVGRERSYIPGPDETLIELARRAGLGYLALTQANPQTDPWAPAVGREILLPYAFIPPRELVEGITINLAELRLYLLWPEQGRQRIRAYAIGIGSEGRDTPEGDYTITQRVEKPSWTAPASVRAARPDGPTLIPPGPDNPLGDYWLGLSLSGYGIHGTNRSFGIGRRVSHGCLRLYPEDIEDLFPRAPRGTPVRIIYQPIKVGVQDGDLFVEIHPDPRGAFNVPEVEVQRQIQALSWKGVLDSGALETAIAERRGMPVRISAN